MLRGGEASGLLGSSRHDVGLSRTGDLEFRLGERGWERQGDLPLSFLANLGSSRRGETEVILTRHQDESSLSGLLDVVEDGLHLGE